MVGELFILGFRGTSIPGWLRDFASGFGLGGVILFDYDCQTKTYRNNIESPEQLKALCREIHALPSRPLVFIDQEGGKVRRLKEKLGFAPLPSQFALNRLPLKDRRAIIEKSFTEMKSLGIDFNLAPVIDLNLNPANPDIGAIERSYSDKPAEVRANARLLLEIAERTRLGLSMKHYPGLGGAKVNSHEELTDLSDVIVSEQLELFYELGGKSILVSHGIVRQWDPESPISMSLVGLGRLRGRLPHTLLISDDLQMQALQKKFSSGAACARGLESGLDMVLIGNNLMAEDEKVLGYAEGIGNRVPADSLRRVRETKASLV